MSARKSALKAEISKQKNNKSTKDAKPIKVKQAKAFNIVPPPLPTKSLIATASAESLTANIDITFFLGKGQITASLFRHGMMINSQSVSSDGIIFFSDTQSGDVISVNGVATGVNPENGNDIPNAATIKINRQTSPSTPQQFRTGFIIGGYIVL